MEQSEHDDKDDHLGEGDDDIAGVADHGQHTQDCGSSACSWLSMSTLHSQPT